MIFNKHVELQKFSLGMMIAANDNKFSLDTISSVSVRIDGDSQPSHPTGDIGDRSRSRSRVPDASPSTWISLCEERQQQQHLQPTLREVRVWVYVAS